MAANTKNQTKASDAIPAGYEKRETFAKRMEIEIGLEFEGVLGAVQPSKKAGFKDYRTIRVVRGTCEPGLYFLPTHAALQTLMDEPNGTEVFCRLTAGSGETEDPYLWTVGVKPVVNG